MSSRTRTKKGFAELLQVEKPGSEGWFKVISVDKSDGSVELSSLDMPESMNAKNTGDALINNVSAVLGVPVGRGNICWATSEFNLEKGDVVLGYFDFHPSKALQKGRMPEFTVTEFSW